MVSKSAIYWAVALGVAAAVAASPVVIKRLPLNWRGEAAAPAPIAPQSATTATTAAPAPAVAAGPAASGPTAPPPPAAPGAHALVAAAPASSPPSPAAPAAPTTSAAPTEPAKPAMVAQPNQTVAPAPAGTAPKADEQRPAFDVVRVEPTGDAVIAGRASPRAAVQLRSDGRVVAQANADDSGQFAILPPPFTAGDHRLQLAARSGGAPEVLSDAIGIEVPAAAAASAPSAPAPVASTAPAPAMKKRVEEPSHIVAGAPEPPAKAAAHSESHVAALTTAPVAGAMIAPRVSVLSVDADGAGRLEAKGSAEPNAIVRLYLNNSFLAEAKAGADGRWSLTVERGMTPGAYAIRADQIDRMNGAVSARAEVPFNYPEHPSAPALASAAPPIADGAAPPRKPGAPLVASVERSLAGPALGAGEATRPAPAPAPDQHAAEPQSTTGAAISVTVVTTPDQTPSAALAGPDASAPASQAPKPQPLKGPAVAAGETEKPQAKQGDAVVPEIRTAKVVRGDNLWNLSEHFYGYGPHYRAIYEANASQIRNPRLIYPDQIFVVPQKPVD